MTRGIFRSLFVGSLLVITGCKTDALYQRGKSPPGPVTNLNAPAGVKVPDIHVVDAKEIDLVEAVLTHRALYGRYLHLLHEYYRENGNETKRRWAAHELEDIDRIKPYRYIIEAEIPPEDLRPTDSVALADQIYDRAMKLMKEGGHSVPIFYREQKMKEALAMLKELIENYPTSDKIDDAAFFCGEIHKEYFKDEETLAVKWYERAMTWNPKTPHPVRFQAAVVYDYRLHDRKRALELYQSVLHDETDDQSNLNFATARIAQLTRDIATSPRTKGG